VCNLSSYPGSIMSIFNYSVLIFFVRLTAGLYLHNSIIIGTDPDIGLVGIPSGAKPFIQHVIYVVIGFSTAINCILIPLCDSGVGVQLQRKHF
jgi:uncharacterized membrane protein YuzA (DUF378 family)